MSLKFSLLDYTLPLLLFVFPSTIILLDLDPKKIHNFSYFFVSFSLISLFLFSFSRIINQVKTTIKSLVLPGYKQKDFPPSLEPLKGTIGTSTLRFSFATTKLGGVVKDYAITQNTIVNHTFLNEFERLPTNLMSNIRGWESLIYKMGSLRSVELEKTFTQNDLFRLYSKLYLDRMVLTDYKPLKSFIESYIDLFGVYVEGGTFRIDDAEDLFLYVCSESAFYSIFGPGFVKDEKLRNMICNLASPGYLKNRPKHSLSKIIREYGHARKYKTILNYLANLIKKEMKSTDLTDRDSMDKMSIFWIINKHPELTDGNYELIAKVLIKLMNSVPSYQYSNTTNILVDIATRPEMLLVLLKEQSHLARKYGFKITLDVLNKMDCLDAFILESLSRACSSNSRHRLALKEYTLSNGFSVPENTLVSLNVFSKYHETDTEGNETSNFDFMRHVESKDKLNDPKISLIWGTKGHICPASDYSSIQMKLITAILIRGYYIFSNIEGRQPTHPGYTLFSTTIPSVSVIYLKKHDFSVYN